MLNFSSWQIKTEGIENLLSKVTDKSLTVWRCEDGSITVGNAEEFGPEDEDTECTEDGTVADWLG
jgi:hypothetical protein